MTKIFLCDLDGTIADCSHRLHFIEKKNWSAFFAACTDDKPIADVIWLIRLLHDAGQKIIYMSGRSDEVRHQTIEWLHTHHLPSGPLYMRRHGDHRPDSLVKSELVDEVIREYSRDQIAGIFDDRQQVVDMYRQRGFRVYQVAPGDF